MHGAYSKYIDVMTEVKWIDGLTGKNQIIPVTIFFVMLYNPLFWNKVLCKGTLIIYIVVKYVLKYHSLNKSKKKTTK